MCRGGDSRPTDTVRRRRPNIVSLVNADVSANVVGMTSLVNGGTRSVPDGYKSAEVGNSVWLSIEAIKADSRARKELVDQNVATCEDVTARNRYGIDLTLHLPRAAHKNACSQSELW